MPFLWVGSCSLEAAQLTGMDRAQDATCCQLTPEDDRCFNVVITVILSKHVFNWETPQFPELLLWDRGESNASAWTQKEKLSTVKWKMNWSPRCSFQTEREDQLEKKNVMIKHAKTQTRKPWSSRTHSSDPSWVGDGRMRYHSGMESLLHTLKTKKSWFCSGFAGDNLSQ